MAFVGCPVGVLGSERPMADKAEESVGFSGDANCIWREEVADAADLTNRHISHQSHEFMKTASLLVKTAERSQHLKIVTTQVMCSTVHGGSIRRNI